MTFKCYILIRNGSEQSDCEGRHAEMKRFFWIIGVIVCLSLANLSLATCAAHDDPVLTNTMITARMEIWKAINSGSTGSAVVAVMDNGSIVYAEGFGMADRENSLPVNRNTIFNIGSVSKVYAAVAVMLLVDEGRIDLDKPVTTYLPEFIMADGRYRDITVRMLLNHSSGLPGTIGPNSFGFEYNNDYYREFLDSLAKSRLKHRPGEMAPYCNDGFTLAEIVVAKVSGKTFMQFLSERVFKPLALSNTGPGVGLRQEQKGILAAKYYTTGGKREPLEVLSVLGAGGLSADAVDMCRFADSFSGYGTQVLSKSALTEMKKGQPSEFADKLQNPGFSHGLGWDETEIARYGNTDLIVEKTGKLTVRAEYI